MGSAGRCIRLSRFELSDCPASFGYPRAHSPATHCARVRVYVGVLGQEVGSHHEAAVRGRANDPVAVLSYF